MATSPTSPSAAPATAAPAAPAPPLPPATLEEKVDELYKKLAVIDAIFSGEGSPGAAAKQLEDVRTKKEEILTVRMQFQESLRSLEDLCGLLPSKVTEKKPE